MTFRGWLYRHGYRWDAQNLDRDGRGSMWREGRCWLRHWAGDSETGEGYRELWEISPSWVVLGRSRHTGFALEFGSGDSDRGITAFLGLHVAAVWLSVEGIGERLVERILPFREYEYQGRRGRIYEAREIKVSIHSGALWWSFWQPTMEWSSKTPRWRNGCWHPLDTLLGRAQYRSKVVQERGIQVPMPEGSYEATAKLTEDSWIRPRWPLGKHILRCTIDVPEGIPEPGKGENSWDCGDDATFGITVPARSIHEGIGKLVASVTETRLRRGGTNWQPARAGA